MVDRLATRRSRAKPAILQTYDRALNMLALAGARPRELRGCSCARVSRADRVDVAIERLERAGLLDDASFARQFTRSKAVGADSRAAECSRSSRKRGVARDISDDAIEAVFDEEGVDEAAIDRARGAQEAPHARAASIAPTRERRLYCVSRAPRLRQRRRSARAGVWQRTTED